jgi:hypothetical protein
MPGDIEPRRLCLCAYCDEDIREGDEVVRTYEDDIVHADCWRGWCDEMYRESYGVISADKSIN